MTTEQMIKKIQDFQTKISTFEDNYNSKYIHLEKRQKIHEILESKNEELLQLQQTRVSIDLGGKEVEISTVLIKDCKFDNILIDLIADNNQKVFLDMPKKYFKRILYILRYKAKGSDTRKIRVEISSKMTEDLMKSIIIMVFKGEEIMKELLITKKNEEHSGSNIMEYLWKKEIDIIPVLNPNPYNNFNQYDNEYNQPGANYDYNDY